MRVIARILCALGIALLSLADPSDASAQQRVGGRCRYDVFPGKAVIVSVAPDNAEARAATPYQPLAVTFAFTPATPITGEPLYRPGVQQQLILVNGMPPGPRFAAKYGLAAGRELPCELHIIRQGTCTPTLYRFPGIDLTDSFELGQP